MQRVGRIGSLRMMACEYHRDGIWYGSMLMGDRLGLSPFLTGKLVERLKYLEWTGEKI